MTITQRVLDLSPRPKLRLSEIERLIKKHRILVPTPSRRMLIEWCEDGTFEIKGIPVGSVSVVVWHEPDIFSPSKDGKKMDLKEGENTLPEVKIKK